MSESFLNGKVELHCGDMAAVLPTLAENSIDSCVSDPPYHLTSIVKRFGSDKAAPAKAGKTGAYARASAGFMGKQWDGGDIAFRVETWAEVHRVLKPGAYVVAFSSTRTFGRMQVAIEDAGFITHPFIAWIFGQGFPKAHRVEHEDWEGWRYGTQSLKPSLEPICVGQKPFDNGLTGTANILKWGTGAINIDGCRVETDWTRDPTARGWLGCEGSGTNQVNGLGFKNPNRLGRWPSNIIHDGSQEVVAAFPDSDGQLFDRPRQPKISNGIYGDFGEEKEFVARGDTGSAARFFYAAKADSDDRLGSKHPTVKPVDLMQYLVRLVTPRGGLVLDPFAGTGTTGEAAFREGFRAVLIERESEYQDDIRRRMALALGGPDERARESMKAKLKDQPQDHGPLFGGTEMSRGGAGRYTATSQTKTNDWANRNDEVVNS